MSASGDTCPVVGDVAFSRCLGLGAFQWMERLLERLPGSSAVGMGSEPPAVSEITARLAYVAMTATTSKLALRPAEKEPFVVGKVRLDEDRLPRRARQRLRSPARRRDGKRVVHAARVHRHEDLAAVGRERQAHKP